MYWAFKLYGISINALVLFYFTLLFVAVALFVVTFRHCRFCLLLLMLYLAAHYFALDYAQTTAFSTIHNSRFFPVIALLPSLYLILLMATKVAADAGRAGDGRRASLHPDVHRVLPDPDLLANRGHRSCGRRRQRTAADPAGAVAGRPLAGGARGNGARNLAGRVSPCSASSFCLVYSRARAGRKPCTGGIESSTCSGTSLFVSTVSADPKLYAIYGYNTRSRRYGIRRRAARPARAQRRTVAHRRRDRWRPRHRSLQEQRRL